MASPQTAQDVITLLDDPETLLRQCYVSISGGAGAPPPNGQAVLATFRVEIDPLWTRPGFTTGISGLRGKVKNRPRVKIVKLGAYQNPAPADHFNAYYIPMVQVADVAAGNSHYSLPTTGAIRYAITSQITGCVFSMSAAPAGGALVSHVQPGAGGQGAAVTAGAQGMGANPHQVRRGHEYQAGDAIAIIGRLSQSAIWGARWKFYMQRIVDRYDVNEVRSAAKIVTI